MKKYIRSARTSSEPYTGRYSDDIFDLTFAGVPQDIIDRTIENIEVYHMDLYDSFDNACRELAPKGSELYKAWYYGDFRLFIPNAYDDKYLDFEKYPLKYDTNSIESSTSIECSEYTSENPLLVECPRGPYYVWEEFGTFKGSTENPNSRITNAFRVQTFDGFDSLDEVVDYVKEYF